MKEGKEEIVLLKEVIEGDYLIVCFGDKMLIDGVILKGEIIVDELVVIGELKGIKKWVNDKVIGGFINGDGMIEIEVIGIGENGYLVKVMEMVWKV